MELFSRILVTSSKGGIGKSTVSLGIAVALAERGRRVLLVDCDTGNRCLDLLLGVEDRVLYDWGDVALGRCTPEDALIPIGAADGLCFCAAPNRLEAGCDIAAVIAQMAEAAAADFVLCDTAGSGEAVQAIAAHFADGALVLATQQPASIRAAEKTAALVREIKEIPCRLVISLFEDRAAADGIRLGLLSIIDRSHLRTVGVVPKDRALLLSQEKGQLPPKRSPARRALANIAERISGREVPLFTGVGRIKTHRVL